MIGFALYAETEAISELADATQELLAKGRPRQSAWRAVVEDALTQLGGKATLAEIYQQIEPRRPSATAFWKEKIRQQLQRHFHSCGSGIWSLADGIAA